jgi:catecholate siderophore receptor
MKNRTFASQRPTHVRKRRGSARLFVLGAAFAASGLAATRPADAAPQAPVAGQAATAPAQTYSFDIPAGPISAVAEAFQRITGRNVSLANPDLGMVYSPGVSGRLTADAAMAQLLAGTTLRASPDAAGIRLGLGNVTETVDVSGAAPVASSPKYTVPLRDVGQTVALIPRTIMEEQGATTLAEALRNVPGITLQAGEGGGASNTAGDAFNMRGFNASNSLFVDNVRDDGLLARDTFNLEQVEVFMGPTGSDVGRGNAAGYINMQTKAPYLGSSNTMTFQGGSASQARVNADLNWSRESPSAPSPEGSWLRKSAVRLNVLWQDRGVPGRDEARFETRAVAPSVALGLGTPTRLVASAQIMRQDNIPDYGIPIAAWDGEAVSPTQVRASQPVDSSNYYGSPEYDYDEAAQDAYTVRVERDFNRNLVVRNQTRYIKSTREAVISAITGTGSFNPATNEVTVARQGNRRENTIVSNQTTLVDRFSTGRLRHAVSASLEYSFEKQFTPTLTGFGTRLPATTDIFSPSLDDPITGFGPTRTGAESEGQSHTVAVSAFDTIELNQRWLVSGGLRLEHYQTDSLAKNAAGEITTDLSGSGNLVSGKASVLFRVSEEGNLYLSYGTTLTPPGAANFALNAQPTNQNNPNVDPQESSNLELGTKWDVAQRRLSLNGAIFRTENTNVIFVVDATAVPPVFNQDDGQIVRGVSLGALGRITDNWEVLANFAYLDTELVSQNLANAGRRLTLTPEYSGSLWTTYRFPKGIALGGGVRHSAAAYVNAANTLRLPAYQVVDALLEWAIARHLTLRANIYNLTDEQYIRSLNNNGGRYNPGYARSVLITTQVRF